MGKLSLLLVVAVLATSGMLLLNMQDNATEADERVWEHQFQVLSRDIASTGMSTVIRRLANHLNQNWSTYAPSFQVQDVAYNDGHYDVETVSDGSCSILTTTRLANLMAAYGVTNAQHDLIEVRVTGVHERERGPNDAEQSHRMVACYLQADWNDPKPPAFQYAFISNLHFDFNGGPEIQAYIDGEGNIHSNDIMTLGPQVVVDGHATYTQEEGSSVHKNTTISSFGYGNTIPMVAFDPADYDPYFSVEGGSDPPTETEITSDYRYDPGDLTIGEDMVIADPDLDWDNPVSSASDPYLWYVKGNLTIQGNAHLRLPGYTIIVVEGTLDISGGAHVTVSGTLPEEEASIETWIGKQLLDGEHVPLGWYSNGDITLNGTGSVIGNFYTNGDFTLDGGGTGSNLVGSVAALGTITGNGGGNGNNFWFVEAGEETIIPGVLLPGKQIIRLAFAEWTDPVLDNAGS